MNLKNLTVFNLADRNMSYLAARQKVLAENIANASTPNYLPKDVAKPDFIQEITNSENKLSLRATNAKHFTELKSVSDKKDAKGFAVYTPQPKNALTIDGNGVVLEDQMNEASKASSEYKRMITIYNSYKNMLSTATTKITG